MCTAFSWPWRISIVVALTLVFGGHPSAAQPLPGPADEETSSDSVLPDPQPAQQEVQTAPSSRARLGITLDPRFRNAVVRNLTPDGAADHAGLEPGDTIVAINGNRVGSYRDLQDFVDTMRPGDIVDIDFSRRITGRTQAVLDGDVPGEPTRANGRRDDAGRDAVDQAAYEEESLLPAPRNRTQQQPSRRGFSPRFGATGDDRADDENEQVDRESDRDREPAGRGRGFIRWRRN